MRTKEQWMERIRPKMIKNLTPRIQKDLEDINEPDSLPEEIQSSFIYGPARYGKTIYSVFMKLKEEENLYLDKVLGKECVFISTPELFQQIKQTYEKSSEKTEQEIINYYSNVHLLILDDFGTMKTTDWLIQTLYLIINRRYENMMKTIFTSNKSLSQLAIDLGDDRITSRIESMCILIKKTKYKK